MRRTAFDDRRDQAVADDYLGTQAACKWCGKLTEVADLNIYGARCRLCYVDFCRDGFPPQPVPLTADDKRAILARLRDVLQPKNPKAWAYALRDREQAGEVLSSVQRKAWRDALRFDGTIGDDTE